MAEENRFIRAYERALKIFSRIDNGEEEVVLMGLLPKDITHIYYRNVKKLEILFICSLEISNIRRRISQFGYRTKITVCDKNTFSSWGYNLVVYKKNNRIKQGERK